jgi:hypothetical protein
MGVNFHEIIIWIELIRDKAATEGIDPKVAISRLNTDLKSYNELNTIQKAIQKRQQDLAALDIAVERKKQAIASLVDFQSKGISDTELIELNKLINSWGGWSHEQNNNGVNTVNRLARLDDKLHTPIN